MSPTTKYLTAYEKEHIRRTGEQLIRITLDKGVLTPEAQMVKNDLVAQLGLNKVCRLIRVELEDTKSRDLNRAIINIGEMHATITKLNSPEK